MVQPECITNYKRLGHLNTAKWQFRRVGSCLRLPIIGMDTETDSNGNLLLLADSDGDYLDQTDALSIARFLHQTKYQNSWNFFYNLTFDAEVILKTLGDILFEYEKKRKLSFKIGDYHFNYIPTKKLSVAKGKHSAVFYDIAQYYASSLVNAYQENIAKLPESYLQMKGKRDSFTKTYYNTRPRQVREYCIQDCIYTKQLSEHWINLFNSAFGFYPRKWLSSGYLGEKVLINNKVNIPKFIETPFEIQDMAWSSYYGGRFEILKRGYIGEGYLYDINSCYPFAFSKIPDITKGKWKNDLEILPDAHLGFFKIRCDIPFEQFIPPFAFRGTSKVIFPTGSFITYTTLAELKNANPDHYKILESFQFVDDKPEYPFEDFVNVIYKKRLELKEKGDPLQLPLKVILNAIYGKTSQRVGRNIGNLFNPVIASTITGTGRAMLYDFVTKNNIEKQTVSFATDSVITQKRLDINSDRLGDFKFEKSGYDVYVLQNGIYRFNGKWKQRGLGKLGARTIEQIDTEERDGQLYMKFKVLRVSRLRSSIIE